jgi:tetratricopeptide (TPR) repeat protein/cold shock CspA family protein
MVFEQAVKEPGERAAQIVRIIRSMDVDYESDRQAFDYLIRGRALADLFGDLTLAYQIFDAALESGASKWYVLHQRAVFELNHFRGTLKRALDAIKEAELAAPHPDRAIRHTRALILRRLALETDNPAERDRYRSEAKGLLARQLDSARESHPHVAYAQILIDELDELTRKQIEGDNEAIPLAERAISELAREIEQVIFVGLQRFPGDEHLLVLESRFAQLIENDPRSARALERAFASSPGRAFVAVRLARYLVQKGNLSTAKKTLEQCLQQNPSSKEAHFEYAKLLSKESEARLTKEIGHHLRRSFTKGDTNYDARFAFARHEFVHGNREEAVREFAELAESRLAPEVLNRIQRPVLTERGEFKEFRGVIKVMYSDYCFVTVTDLGADVFAHMSQFPKGGWDNAIVGAPVVFTLTFRMRGPFALGVKFG